MKPLTLAQKIYGKDFDNTPIINERPANLRSNDPAIDKILFQKYRGMRKVQTSNLKFLLR